MTRIQDDVTQVLKAVLYCRVSDKAQEKKGNGLASQEACAREYARFKNYDVVDVFREVLTGGESNRPVMAALLAYLRKHKKEGRVVIIDDLSRFARDVVGYWQLRDELKSAGGLLESPSIVFGDDADSVFRENILASVAQHQRQKNAEQTKNRMRGRVLNGYWPFAKPIGYRHERKPGEGMVLVRDEPVASVIQEALEGYASGRFQIQAEVKRFLEWHPDFPKDASGIVRNQLVTDILTRVLYAGHVEAPEWDVSLRKGRHEGLINFETFERIQKRLKAGAYASARADISADFPLRGMVKCGDCEKALTACWSRSRTGERHPYYMCFNTACVRNRKSIRRERIEGEFVALLERLTPAPQLFDLARAMFKDAWQQRAAQAASLARSCELEAAKIEKQIGVLLDRIVDATSQSVVSAYEKRIAALERDKALLTEKSKNVAQPKGTFEQMFELAMCFLSSPSKIWSLGTLEYQKLVLRLTFADRLSYCANEGFRTPKTAMPFKLLESFGGGENKMARPERFELPTPRFVVWCSIQLSYGR
ncbi:MAG: site-specific recombinase [Hyphomicrobiales bacterium]|nr:site-specific recombinase [Hyphomicrobiales bacterium]